MTASTVITQNRQRRSRKRPRSTAVQHACKGAVLLCLLRCTSASGAGGGEGGGFRPPGSMQWVDQPGEYVEIRVSESCALSVVASRLKRVRIARPECVMYVYTTRILHLTRHKPSSSDTAAAVERCNVCNVGTKETERCSRLMNGASGWVRCAQRAAGPTWLTCVLL